MIYSIYLNGLNNIRPNYSGFKPDDKVKFKNCDPFKLLGEFILAHPEHKFLVMTTTEQKPLLEQFMKDGGLQDCIVNKWERGVTNANYPDKPRRLHMHVFSSCNKGKVES